MERLWWKWREDERTLILSELLDPAIPEGHPPLHFPVMWGNALLLSSSSSSSSPPPPLLLFLVA